MTDVSIVIPEDCTITRCTILTKGGTGSCQVDVWAVPIASYPPSVANSICAGHLPTISSGISHDDSTLTGWNTVLPKGQAVTFHLVSSSVFTEIVFQLVLQRTGVANITGYTDAQAIAAVASALANTGNVRFTFSGGAISANYVATGTSHLQNGYETLSSGLIIQWGQIPASTNNGNLSVNFPIAFPNNVFNIQATIASSTGVEFWTINDGSNGPAPTLSNFNIYTNNTSKVNWVAIGN